jgi:UTP--glucose-1-phosphate uridylyltransferase
LNVIKNPKTCKGNVEVYQLETAIGAAMSFFPNPIGVEVARDRFLPVKTTSDLLLLRSDLYSLEGSVLRQKKGQGAPPVIKLSPAFKKVEDFLKRVQHPLGIADLKELEVSGDVTFGENVILKGQVLIEACPGSSLHIPSGSQICNQKVTGTLNVVDIENGKN